MEMHKGRSNSVKRLLSQNLQGVDSKFLKVLDAGKAAAEKNLWFFEIAWEVANQGGPSVTFSFILVFVTHQWSIIE
jgi:hypothetical protein